MLYATWSEGYRPGGVQRNPIFTNYASDFLTNYEIGWKTRFADDRLQFNGAVFLDEWDDIQVSFQGDNGITQVANGPSAEIQGIEVQLDWLPTDSLRIGSALAYYDSELKDEFCPGCNADGSSWAPAGTALPVTPDFKANLIARYTFPLGAFEAHMQGALAYSTSRASLLNVEQNEIYGDIPSSTFLDLAFGITNEKYAVELFLANVTDEDSAIYVTSQCIPETCGVQPNAVTPRPFTFGIRFSQDF
jgi:outer membrane receptor protein involved in Fe transport